MEIQRESIFVSSLRGFCRSLFIMLGFFAAAFVAVLAMGVVSSPYQDLQKTEPEILPDLDWKVQIAPLTAPVVLQINIHGAIGMSKELDSQTIRSVLVDSRTGLLDHNRVKAILLHFNTPGGTVTDSDNIYRMLLEYKEKYGVPVFGYIDGMCASGGMYIASAADRLYGSSSAVVGSVGVRSGPFFNVVDTMSKIGVQAETLTEGLGKDALNPFRTWKPNEGASIQTLIHYYYEQFVDIVARGRPRVDRNKLVGEYGANIFDVAAAERIGYIDVANSTYEQTLRDLMKEAKIDLEKPYQIVELKPKRRLLNELVNGKSPLVSGTITHALGIEGLDSKQETCPVSYLYKP